MKPTKQQRHFGTSRTSTRTAMILKDIMKNIELVIDFDFMTKFEPCYDFISFVKEAIEKRHGFKDIKFENILGSEIVLTSQFNTEMVSKMGLIAADIMDIVYEYNRARTNTYPFLVNIYAVISDNSFDAERKLFCTANEIQWEK